MNDKKTFTGLYFGALPDLNDLVAYLVEEEDEGLKTIQPLGCREFLFTEPRVLLSPCLESGNQAFIVCKKTVLQCVKFQALMAKLKFKVVRQVEVNKELFRYCLAFTITQKLAPLWNKTGEYFVQGRDFLECASKLNAVSIDVNITDRLCIGLKAFNIKLQLSRPDHFCSSSNILQSFLTQKSFIVNRDSIQDDLCYVLPSLKKGRVVGICHEIPSDSPFPCYEDLRRHWKLMYGYRLPPNESTFYNVRFFHFSNSKIFTYPSSCIHSNYPQISPRCDQQPIFQAFLQDIQKRIPLICEAPFRLTSSALYLSNNLHRASNDRQSSLSRVPPQLKHCTPFVYSHIEHKQTSASTPCASETDATIRRASVLNGDNPLSVSKPARIIPTFTSRTQASHSNAQCGRKSTQDLPTNTPKVRPVFKAKSTPSKVANSIAHVAELVAHTFSPSTLVDVYQHCTPSKQQDMLLTRHVTSHTKTLPDTRPGLALVRGASKRPSILGRTGNLTDIQNSRTGTASLDNPANTGILFTTSITPRNYSIIHSVRGTVQDQTSTSDQYADEVCRGNTSSKNLQQSGIIPRLWNGSLQGTPNKKQNITVESNAVQVKKPRLKPRIQEDIDVRQLALDNQLKKVNTITLMDWLRKHNVPVKQKDKKMELIEKVMGIVTSNVHES